VKSVSIASSVASIGNFSFIRCIEMTSIVIPMGVESIGQGAFQTCKGLVNVSFPSTLTSIGERAFQSCSNLPSVTLPDSLTSLPVGLFAECTSLESAIIPSTVTSLGEYVFQRCPSLKTIVIPEDVEIIPKGAFYGCFNLTNVTIPSKVKELGPHSFRQCYSLDNVFIPSNVEIIGESAFTQCPGLNSITLSNGVKSLGVAVFYGCNLTTISIPASVESIGNNPFIYCDNLESINVDAANEVYMSIEGVLFQREGMVLLQFPYAKEGDYSLPDNCTEIVEYSFEGATKVTSVSIPASVSKIGDSPFDACLSLTSINVHSGNKNYTSVEGVLFTRDMSSLVQYPCGKGEEYVMPEGVSTIKPYAFGGCSDVKNVTISSGVTTIEDFAFGDCINLLSINIPSKVETFGTAPFSGCLHLDSINVDDNNPSYIDIEGVLFNHEGTKLIQYACGHSHSYTVPDGVDTIGTFAFYKCRGISAVTLPPSVTSIEYAAFNTVTMAYVNFLGSSEPTCRQISTFSTVDVVCVPTNYSSDTFCGAYKVRVSSCEEFVQQQNQCYEVLEWQAEEITVKKRANATIWEKKTNNCFEYQCLNATGGFAWSKCNSTDETHRMCVDNSCVEESEALNTEKWAVEILVDIRPNDFDIDNVTMMLSNATGILQAQMSIGTESVQNTGFVVRVVVFVDTQESANTVARALEDNKGDSCAVGVLCGARKVQILEKQNVVSGAYNIHNNCNLLMFIVALVMVFVMMF